jgi:hypothetical protein
MKAGIEDEKKALFFVSQSCVVGGLKLAFQNGLQRCECVGHFQFFRSGLPQVKERRLTHGYLKKFDEFPIHKVLLLERTDMQLEEFRYGFAR